MTAAPSTTPGQAAEPAARSSDSARNWTPTWPRVAPRARRRPISERRSSTEITITLAIPTPPTSRATAPSPSSSAVKAVVGGRPGRQRVRRPADPDLVRVARGWRWPARTVAHRLHLVGVGPDVDRARRAVERRARPRRPGTPTRAARSSSGASGTGSQDADHGEPLGRRARPGGRQPVDAEPLGRLGAEHHRRVARRWPALRKRPSASSPAEGVEQRRVGRQHADAAGLGRGDQVAAAHGGVGVAGGRRPARTGPIRRSMPGDSSGSLASAPKKVSPGRDREQVGAEACRAGPAGRPGSTRRCRARPPWPRCRWRCPRADRAARSRRVRSPVPADRAAGRRDRVALAGCRSCRPPRS